MLLWLDILGLLVAAVGAAIALTGEPRRDGKFTRQGRLALVLIATGFIDATTIELLQSRAERRKEQQEQIDDRIAALWQAAEDRPIGSILLAYYRHEENPVRVFTQDISAIRVNISIVTDPASGQVSTRSLQFQRIRKVPDYQQSIALVVQAEGKTRFDQEAGIALFRRGWPGATAPSTGRVPPEMGQRASEHALSGPNDSSPATGARWSSELITAKVAVINGRSYSTSRDYDWTDPNVLACGVEGQLQWRTLGLGERYQSMRDLRRIATIDVILPAGFDLRRADVFKLVFLSRPTHALFLDLSRARYFQNENGSWTLRMDGAELYSRLADEFRRVELQRHR